MKLEKASALIYTRQKNIGFPGGYFKVQPENLPEQTAKKLMEYALDAMNGIEPLRSIHEYSRIVIALDGYVVLGVAAYLRDLVPDGWEAKDEAGRLTHGFVAYVWEQKDFQAVQFPDAWEFGTLICDWIRPHWEDSETSAWAAKQDLVPYQYRAGESASQKSAYTPVKHDGVYIESLDKTEDLLQWAILEAAKGSSVSICTNVTVYDAESYESPFRYVAQRKRGAYAVPKKAPVKREVIPAKAPETRVVIQETVETERGNSGQKAPVILIAAGIAALVLTLLLLPGGFLTSLLRIILLVIAIVCILAGIVRVLKMRKREEIPEIPEAVPTEPENPWMYPGLDMDKKTENKPRQKRDSQEDIFNF